jgi:quercetin dioxygenase-like cupin family protein
MYREESTMSNEQGAPETKGVAVKLLATVDLGPEIEGMAGRHLRMRMVTIEPGGVFGPIHDHKDRPGIVYMLQGTITDHRNVRRSYSHRLTLALRSRAWQGANFECVW